MAQDDRTTTTPPQTGAPADGADAARAYGNGNAKPQNGNGNGGPAAAPQQAQPETEPAKPPVTRSPIFWVVLIIVLVFGGIWGFNFWVYSQNHVSTDDAYVTGDLVNVSPIISGTLSQLNVEEGDQVKAGQIIAKLDDSGPRANYDQAVAAYQAAESQVPQARTNLSYEAANVTAQIQQAQAALNAQIAKTQQSQSQVGLLSETTKAQVLQAQAQEAAALAQAQTAQAQAASARQAITVSQSAASAAAQQVNVAQANYTRAQRDAVRYTNLYGQNGQVAAVTAQQLDQAVATSNSAEAQLQASRDQAAQAQSQVDQYRAQAAAADATYNAAMKQYYAAAQSVKIAQANTIQVPVQQFGVANNAAVANQNRAELSAAQANEQQVSLRRQMVLTAQAQAIQAQAAVDAAKVTLDDCTIAAPSDGTVVKKAVNVGDALTPGQTIATITRGNNVWISANFKETQLQNVQPGQPAEISVDAFPGLTFEGKVQSVNEASGNTTSLLPADNATGNFTKVVQRIPVKIILVPADQNNGKHEATAKDIEDLRQGMSVVATIDVSSGRHNN